MTEDGRTDRRKVENRAVFCLTRNRNCRSCPQSQLREVLPKKNLFFCASPIPPLHAFWATFIFCNSKISIHTLFINEWPPRIRNCSRIILLFGHLFGCHHAEKGLIHRKMAVDCVKVITSIGDTFFQPVFCMVDNGVLLKYIGHCSKDQVLFSGRGSLIVILSS